MFVIVVDPFFIYHWNYFVTEVTAIRDLSAAYHFVLVCSAFFFFFLGINLIFSFISIYGLLSEKLLI